MAIGKPTEPSCAGSRRNATTGRWQRVVLLCLLGTFASCGGALSHRSVANVAADLPIRQGTRLVRLEVADGSVGVQPGPAGTVTIGGGLRRAADTAEDLARLEAIALDFVAGPDPEDPGILVVRAPVRGDGDPQGVFAFELGVKLPADVALEVRIHGSGEVRVEGRTAATEVHTGRGDLIFGDCSGGVSGSTGTGQVLVHGIRGDVDLRAKLGDVNAFITEPGATIRLVTGQGTIQCHVPRDLEFELDGRVETGHASANAFGIESRRVGDFGAELAGTRGSGRTKIVLRSGSGHVSLSPLRS